MHIIPGIILGCIFGIIGAIGGTLYGSTTSNIVGDEYFDCSQFIPEGSEVTYHLKQDIRKK